MGLLLLQGASDLNPRELFANGEQGLWLDPSQMSTMFTDSAGTTSVTAAGDPVGLILDQSRGGLSQIGADLVTNGTFAADSDWTKGANWTIGSGVATKTGGAANNLTQTIGSTAAAWYRISLDVTRSAGTLTVSLGTSGTTYAITATGSYTFFILAGSGTQTLTLAGDSSFAGTVDNVVVRNVPGNHAYQTTSASRPTLARIPVSGRRNLLTRTEEFDNAAWTKYQSTISPNATTAPDGTSTADSFVDNAVTQEHTCYQSQTTTTATFSVYAKANARSTVGLRAYSNINEFYTAIFDLQNGVVSLDNETGTTFSTTTSSITSVGSGWYRCSISYTRSSGTTFHVIDLCNSTTPTLGTAGSQIYLGNGTGIFIWGAQLETGSSPSNYQKVVATTDVTESGVGDLWHLVFDGSDDSLVTNSVDFTGTDEMTVIAGVRKLSEINNAILTEFSAVAGAGNPGSFNVHSPLGTNPNYAFYLAGDSGPASRIATTFAAPITNVIAASYDISGSSASDEISVRINGVVPSLTATSAAGGGNFGNYQLFIGRRNQTSNPFNGHLYQLIIRGKTTPTGKLLEAERFVGRKTGVSF